MDKTRREFLSIVAALSGAACLPAGCSDSQMADPDAAPADNRCSTAIAENHGHELQITMNDAEAGAAATTPTTLHIQGTSSHDHTITLTPADYQKLLSGESVSVTSSSDAAHTHVVTLSC